MKLKPMKQNQLPQLFDVPSEAGVICRIRSRDSKKQAFAFGLLSASKDVKDFMAQCKVYVEQGSPLLQ